MGLIRLNKYLKDTGLCSRRRADWFIENGYILVNKQLITELGYKVDPDIDQIEVKDDIKSEIAKLRYILLNKPRGYVCSKDSRDGKPIFDLLPKIDGLTYAGRLDKDSHGLIILSNDGKFVYSVAGSEFEKEKVYIVKVNKKLTKEFIESQRSGSIIIDNKMVKKAKVEEIDPYTYQITLTEGINRQLRKMAQSQGYEVVDLKRVSVAGISDSQLKVGAWRNLTHEEIKKITSSQINNT